MKINTALILCAGFGKRLNPLTLDTPKPLIELNNVSVLETCINLIESLGIQKIILNTFYLKDQIHNFINNKEFKSKISIIEDGENILDTGGGINNMMKHTNEDNILICLSTSGNSKNILEAIRMCNKKGGTSISFLGSKGIFPYSAGLIAWVPE